LSRQLQKKASSSRPSKPTAAVKSKFADFRVKMKQQKAATDISSTSEDILKAQLVAEEVRTFDAGFFHVSSPVSSPKYHCEGRYSATFTTSHISAPYFHTLQFFFCMQTASGEVICRTQSVFRKMTKMLSVHFL